jgi:hypothetical protein
VIGVSNRVIAFYEAKSSYRRARLLVDFFCVLRCATDEPLGVKPTADPRSPKTVLLRKRLRCIAEPRADQRALLKLVDVLLKTR